jgi:hypothetical protein
MDSVAVLSTIVDLAGERANMTIGETSPNFSLLRLV